MGLKPATQVGPLRRAGKSAVRRASADWLAIEMHTGQLLRRTHCSDSCQRRARRRRPRCPRAGSAVHRRRRRCTRDQLTGGQMPGPRRGARGPLSAGGAVVSEACWRRGAAISLRSSGRRSPRQSSLLRNLRPETLTPGSPPAAPPSPLRRPALGPAAAPEQPVAPCLRCDCDRCMPKGPAPPRRPSPWRRSAATCASLGTLPSRCAYTSITRRMLRPGCYVATILPCHVSLKLSGRWCYQSCGRRRDVPSARAKERRA